MRFQPSRLVKMRFSLLELQKQAFSQCRLTGRKAESMLGLGLALRLREGKIGRGEIEISRCTARESVANHAGGFPRAAGPPGVSFAGARFSHFTDR